ncbi:MAG TPA: zinc ABC transporter substrate-binding protein [Stellaceae bacterium]|nr:zinc ABC transporter substrate-binding protein [Stellaceae bacterium]
MRPLSVLMAALALLSASAASSRGAVTIVAAENFYGDVARQIGGPDVAVTSILNNPGRDPHLFEASPSVARAVSAARIVICNGLGYDPWAEKLLQATQRTDRKTLVVAALAGRRAGDNPHIWYDPATMVALAGALAADLGGVDPAHRSDYRRRFARFRQSIEPLEARIAALRRRLSGVPAAATEPVFGYMLAALGMPVRNPRFQLAVMNGTEPGASDIANFEHDLATHQVRLLVYNSQASDPTAERMVKLAEAAHIPVVAVSETEPPGEDYQAWIASELDAVARALPG